MGDSWLSEGERVIEDLREGDRVLMDIGTCEVLRDPEETRYGFHILVKSPYGQVFGLTYRAGSPFLLEEH